ncbi:MAG: LysM peptidoglycan-binding domain-containing protein [Gallionella sp.]|nr:LysM peptidoglycan-binding domain-containing protein [Gallionella sp.]
MRKIISLICLLLPILACADQLHMRPDARSETRPEIRSDAPDRHIVVKGDTLWDISGKFFKDPWKWPYIWGLNKNTIKDPHWIYPGDVINLDRANGTLRIGAAEAAKQADQAEGTKPAVTNVEGVTSAPAVNAAAEASEPADMGNNLRLSPKVHEKMSAHDAIPSIPANILGPFLIQPLVVEEEALKDAPTMLGAREGRVLIGKQDIGFARGLTADKGDKWQIYRPGKKLIDPETQEVLGVEAIYLGNAEVMAFADVSTVSISRSVQEISQGDLLYSAANDAAGPYLPRAPETAINTRVISVYGGVSQAGQNTAIVLNKGARDGLEVGHVLALYHKGEVVREKSQSFWSWDKYYTLPDERYGLVFVFRVFNKVSYALVMQTKLPVQLLDRAQNP